MKGWKRSGCVVAILIVLATALCAVLLLRTTPHEAKALPLTACSSCEELMSRVPATAREVIIAPRAAAILSVAKSRPSLRALIGARTADLPAWTPMLLGGADVIAWRDDDRLSFVCKPAPFRALLLRVALAVSGEGDVRFDGPVLLFRVGEEQAAENDLWRRALALGGDDKAEMFLIHSEESRRSFPPIDRPAITGVTFENDRVIGISRADGTSTPERTIQNFRPPLDAPLAASVTAPPRVLKDLQRIFPADISALLSEGATLVLYDVEQRKLIPLPLGVVVLPPSSPAPAGEVKLLELPLGGAGSRSSRSVSGIEIIRTENDIFSVDEAVVRGARVISFDGSSIERYIADAAEEIPLPPGTTWAMRANPGRLLPILERLKEDDALRLVARNVRKSAANLHRDLELFRDAKSFVAIHSVGPRGEEVRTTIQY